MDQTRLVQPKNNLNWLWWGLGSFIILTLTFKIGAWSSNKNIEGAGKKVGIVHINGPILNADATIKQLENLRTRSDVSAIVVRIDSPGGLVSPTQEIYKKIKSIKGEKPIIASMGVVAASGGYYVALESDTIMANEGTIVGSIGVVMNYPVMTELLNKVGVEFETVKSGQLKDVGSYSRAVTKADREHLNEMVTDMYDQFVNAVLAGRNMELEEVKPLADGRVFTGLQSKKLGLIDTIGTYEDAIALAGLMGQIKGKPKTVQLNKKRPSILDWFSVNLGHAMEKWVDKFPAYRWRIE